MKYDANIAFERLRAVLSELDSLFARARDISEQRRNLSAERGSLEGALDRAPKNTKPRIASDINHIKSQIARLDDQSNANKKMIEVYGELKHGAIELLRRREIVVPRDIIDRIRT